VTTDPHSFNTLKNEYPQFGSSFDVKHYTAVLVSLFEDGKLIIKNRLPHYRVTFHDPCYLGRYNGGFSAPRRLLASLGVEFHEMPRNCENSFCCGAGGGRMWMEETRGTRINAERTRQALATGADGVATACPFCMVMMKDGLAEAGQNVGGVVSLDIAELLAERLAAAPERRLPVV